MERDGIPDIGFVQHRECRGCTHVGDSGGSDSDGPPELIWTHDSNDQGSARLHPSSESETERESPTSLGDSEPHDLWEKTIAQNSSKETLRPTGAEIIALQVIDELRLQSQSTVGSSNVIHPHGSIDESRVGSY